MAARSGSAISTIETRGGKRANVSRVVGASRRRHGET
jgi:hypothetical protein